MRNEGPDGRGQSTVKVMKIIDRDEMVVWEDNIETRRGHCKNLKRKM